MIRALSIASALSFAVFPMETAFAQDSASVPAAEKKFGRFCDMYGISVNSSQSA